MKRKTLRGMQSLGQILDHYDLSSKKYISQEFQDYGYRLSIELDDEKHKSLYIKLAKTIPRVILEEARIFIKDAYNVRNKARLFMWKVKQLRNESKEK